MDFKMHPDTEAKLLEISSQMSRSRGPSRMNTRPPSLAASRHSLHESHLRHELSKETQKGFQIDDRYATLSANQKTALSALTN